MQVEVIPMLINSDFFNAPLDVKMHLADYKMYGKKSYVYQIKELLYGIYECTYLSMNDLDICGEALEYFIAKNKSVGQALVAVFGITNKAILEKLSTIQTIANSSTAMQAIANSSTAMQAIANSSTVMQAIANSSTAMQAVANSSTAMQAVANSSTAISILISNITTMRMLINNSTAMQKVANSSTAMQVVANNDITMQAVVNNDIAMQALAASGLRKRVTSGKKAVGLILPMSLGGYVYFDKTDIYNTSGRIEYTDGSLQIFGDTWETGYTGWGDVLRAKTKTAKLVRVGKYTYNNNWIDIILINGNISAI